MRMRLNHKNIKKMNEFKKFTGTVLLSSGLFMTILNLFLYHRAYNRTINRILHHQAVTSKALISKDLNQVVNLNSFLNSFFYDNAICWLIIALIGSVLLIGIENKKV